VSYLPVVNDRFQGRGIAGRANWDRQFTTRMGGSLC